MLPRDPGSNLWPICKSQTEMYGTYWESWAQPQSHCIISFLSISYFILMLTCMHFHVVSNSMWNETSWKKENYIKYACYLVSVGSLAQDFLLCKFSQRLIFSEWRWLLSINYNHICWLQFSIWSNTLLQYVLVAL